VGYSVVRAQDGCIVWNGIHHKTNTHGGVSRYGYPDTTYFSRVKLELADKGVTLASLTEEGLTVAKLIKTKKYVLK
jgi:hypothetical protein